MPTCLVEDCPRGTTERKPLCPRHWRVLPAALRADVRIAYRSGDEERLIESWYVAAIAVMVEEAAAR